MPLEWSKLIETQENIPVVQLGVSLAQPLSTLPLIGDNPQSNHAFILRIWFKIGAQQYIRSAHGDMLGFAWASSDATFAYFLTGDYYLDDGAQAEPPAELLPDRQSYEAQTVARFGQMSGQPQFKNYESRSHRYITFGRYTFCYRNSVPAVGEPPMCIQVTTVFKMLDAGA